MRKPLALIFLASLLMACTGEPVPTTSSESSVSSVASSSSSSVGTGTPGTSPLGNPDTGAALFVSTEFACNVCHTDNGDGTFGGIRSFNVNQFTYPSSDTYTGLNYSSATVQDLAVFISAEMPAAGGCDAQCGADIAAYLWSLRGLEQNVDPIGCSTQDPVFYGKRALKLLTSFEYNNSLKALFTAPLPDDFSSSQRANVDKNIANMPNHINEPVSEARLNSYAKNAEELAEWAIVSEAQSPLPFSCADTQSTACATEFIETFAYPAYRRPLDASERQMYIDMITGSTVGLQVAVQSVLISPHFLYRSELGTKVSEARQDPMFQRGGGNNAAAGFEAGAGGVTVNGAAFSTATTGADNEDGTYNIYDQGSISHSFSFSDPMLLIVNAKGMDFDSRWPEMTITVANQEVAKVMVEHDQLQQYRYLVSGVSGSHAVQISFSNEDEGREPFATEGNDKNLYIGDVTVAPAQASGNSDAEQDLLALADPNAYVLDPFEYASALAYMYTASAPDADLLAAAARGDLADPAIVETHIDRMLDSELGRAQVGRFAGMWFRTDKVIDAERAGNEAFTQAVKDSMAQEIREIYKHVFYDDSVPFEAIYTGDFTMVNSVLSDFYGLPGGNSPDDFTRVSTAGTPRGGVIASGAFMASNSARERTSPIKRAVHFRQDMLCQSIDLPPAFGEDPEQDRIRDAAAAEVVEAQNTGTLTTTEAFHMQTGKPGTACAGCHRSVINPLFAIDDFDNVGLARKRNAAGEVVQRGLGPNGQQDVPIDMINNGGYLFAANITGVVDSGLADAENAAGSGLLFKGAKGLGQAIVDAELIGVEACLIQKSFRFAAGYPLSSAHALLSEGEELDDLEKEHFTCVSDELASALSQHNNNPKAMMKALGTSDVIRFRR